MEQILLPLLTGMISAYIFFTIHRYIYSTSKKLPTVIVDIALGFLIGAALNIFQIQNNYLLNVVLAIVGVLIVRGIIKVTPRRQ